MSTLATTSSTRVLKVKFDDDLRRTKVELPNSGSASDKLQALRLAVGVCFGMDAAELPVLKYQDEDSDMCTLIEASVEDLLALSADGPLYLFVSSADKHNVTWTDAEVEEAENADVVSILEDRVSAKSEESLIAPLLAMGFDETAAITAMERAKGNQAIAVSILLKGSQPQHRSFLGRLFPQFSAASKEPDVHQEGSDANENPAELDPFILSEGPVVDEQSDASFRISMDNAINGEAAMNNPDEAEQLEWVEQALDQSTNVSANIEETSSSIEACSENGDSGSNGVSFGSAEWVEDAAAEVCPQVHHEVDQVHLDPEQVESIEALEEFLDETPQVSSHSNIEDVSTSEDGVDVEEFVELCDSEDASVESNSEAPTESAAHDAADASLIDQGQVLVSRALSAIRTRQFVPESMSSSGGNETRLDSMQILVSKSLSALRCRMQRLPFLANSSVDQGQQA